MKFSHDYQPFRHLAARIAAASDEASLVTGQLVVGGVRYSWSVDDLAVILRRLEWPGVEMPYSTTLVEGIDEDEVIRRLGGDPERAEPMRPALYWERHLDDAGEERCFVGVVTAPCGIVLAVEHNTYAGNIPGVLRDLSVGGRAFNMLNHINAKDSIGYAVNGDLVIFEEPWGPLTPLRPGDRR